MKAIINIENYEAFWVDYLDGKLSETDEERLFAFLESNPEISANLIDTDDFMLPAPEVKFPGKASLKAEHQIENLLISKIENEISAEDDKFITSKINSDAKIAASFSQYQKTILVPDTSIVFEGKKYLKKATVIPLYRYTAAVAAAFAVVFVSGYLLTRNPVEVSPAVKPQFSFIELPVHIKDTSDTEKFQNIIPVNFGNENNYASNQENIIEEVEVEFSTGIDVPERLPMASVNVEKKNSDTYEYYFMEYRNDIPEENIAFEYTMQYKKTPKENQFKSTIAKIYKFGKEVDIKGSYDKLKEAKEELLFTSN